MIHFQTNFEKYSSPGRSSALGGRRRRRQGYFFKMCSKNNLKLTIFGTSYFENRNLASFTNFHHLVGNASYHSSSTNVSPPTHSGLCSKKIKILSDLCLCIQLHRFEKTSQGRCRTLLSRPSKWAPKKIIGNPSTYKELCIKLFKDIERLSKYDGIRRAP